MYDRREQLLVSDPDGAVEALLGLLLEGGRTLDELAAAVSTTRGPVTVADVRAAVDQLDGYGLVEDGDRPGWFGLYVTAVGGLGRLLRRPRVKAAIERITGMLLVAFAVRLATAHHST